MYRQPVWIVFLSLICAGILAYTIHSGTHLYRYLRMNSETEPQSIAWTILSKSDEAFVPVASYTFAFKDNMFQGRTIWNETFLNEWTAQEAVRRLSSQQHTVFFDSNDPEVSALQNELPLKEIIYSSALCLLGLYFVGLGIYTEKRKKVINYKQ